MNGNWTELMKKIREIQDHQNEHKPYVPYSIGDIFVMLEDTFIGRCDATQEDYWKAVEEFWKMEREVNYEQRT